MKKVDGKLTIVGTYFLYLIFVRLDSENPSACFYHYIFLKPDYSHFSIFDKIIGKM